MDNFGTFANPNLQSILPVLENWLEMLAKFNACTNIKVPYWHNERTNVSLLAAAATVSGWQVLEEFHKNKIGYDGKASKGRLDLWLHKETDSFFIEAKQDWPSISGRVCPNAISASMELSVTDTKRLLPTDHRLLALTFVVPRILHSRLSSFDKRIERLVELQKDPGNDMYAWSFLDRYRNSTDGKYLYPGVLLVAKEVSN